jgi:hypothetical protein
VIGAHRLVWLMGSIAFLNDHSHCLWGHMHSTLHEIYAPIFRFKYLTEFIGVDPHSARERLKRETAHQIKKRKFSEWEDLREMETRWRRLRDKHFGASRKNLGCSATVMLQFFVRCTFRQVRFNIYHDTYLQRGADASPSPSETAIGRQCQIATACMHAGWYHRGS